MDIRQLRYFVAVAEELSFSRAAERLHISQPPLSMQVKALEEDLGTRLFDRDRRRVTLTKAGDTLLAEARDILSGVDWAAERTRRTGRGQDGELTVGFTNSAPMRETFSQILRSFRADHPDVAIETRMMSTNQQLEALEAGQLDIGVLRPAFWFRPPPSIALRPLWQDPLDVFLPTDHPLMRQNGPLKLTALRDERFISFRSDQGCGLYEHMVMLCGQAGFQPRIVEAGPVATSILGLVSAGGGVALLPRCQANSGIVGVANRPLADTGAISAIQIASRQPVREALVQNFLDIAESCRSSTVDRLSDMPVGPAASLP